MQKYASLLLNREQNVQERQQVTIVVIEPGKKRKRFRKNPIQQERQINLS
jgi:hypothetical protein